MAATPTLRTMSAGPKLCKAKEIHYADVGTSGGVWGLERGYCLMIGADKPEIFNHLEPILQTLAPGQRQHRADTGPPFEGQTAQNGYLHCGPSGAGTFRQDGPQRHRIWPDAGLWRRLRRHANADSKDLPANIQYNLDLGEIAELWRRGSVVSSWLLDLSAIALARGSQPRQLHRLRAGFGRRALDHYGRA